MLAWGTAKFQLEDRSFIQTFPVALLVITGGSQLLNSHRYCLKHARFESLSNTKDREIFHAALRIYIPIFLPRNPWAVLISQFNIRLDTPFQYDRILCV